MTKYKVGDKVVAVMPPHDDKEVCTILFVKKALSIWYKVEDEDGVRCWIKHDNIIRKA